MSINNNGVLLCGRYAFSPNFYQYCGPDKNKTLSDYLLAGQTDRGLTQILQDFETLYPYLQFISRENSINNPFALRVVEAYWLGNSLLENIKIQDFYLYLKENLGKKLPAKTLQLIYPKLDQGTRVNHAFHVLNIFRRTGHLVIDHTLQTMDNCRIGWGKVIQIKNSKLKMKNDNEAMKQWNNETIIISTQPLVSHQNKLILGSPVEKQIIDQFNLSLFLKTGDWVSFHWGFLCDKLTVRQVKNLHYYTQLAINLANTTI